MPRLIANTHPSPSASGVAAPVTVLPLGATLARITPPGTDANIVLALPSLAAYRESGNPAYFGETIGRVANRISDGAVALNGRSCRLARNDGGRHCLHGGVQGWGKRVWDGPLEAGVAGGQEWRLRSADGDEGFPGAVEAKVRYEARVEVEGAVEKLVLDVEYEVKFADDDEAEIGGEPVEETVCAVTNHSYFSLSLNPTIDGTEMKLASNLHLPVDDFLIPLGEITEFPGVKANETFTVGATEPFFDHCFVVNPDASSVPLDTRETGLKPMVSMYHPETGINLVVESTEPAFQLYTGDGIDTSGFGARAGIAIEPSRYVNAANDERWKCMVRMRRGEVWGSRIRYCTWRS